MKNTFRALLLSSALSIAAIHASAQFSLSVNLSIRTAPPALPVYTQPPCPVEGYLWTPGYWAYDEVDGYYWVPGVWVRPPMTGYLWTPGYWGYAGGIYGWHPGYWGMHIGFYGGVNYGYGYGGSGFVGGEWHEGAFRYNTAVMNVNTTVVHNTYINRTVINNTTINNTTVNNRPSFNGGAGTSARPTVREQAAIRENHVQPTSEQFAHNQTASRDRNQFAAVNNGRPATTAMNSVGGQRFSQQGHNAPAPVTRPAAGMNMANRSRQPHPQQPRSQQQHPQQQPHQQRHPQPQPQPREGGEGSRHREH